MIKNNSKPSDGHSESPSSRPMTLRQQLADIIAPGADKTFIHNYMEHYIDDLEALCQEIAREAYEKGVQDGRTA